MTRTVFPSVLAITLACVAGAEAKTVKAHVVALDQPIFFNRMGAWQPVWLLISSLILSPPDTLALNGGLAGAAITLIGIARFSARETSLAAWTIALLGSWVAVAP